MIFQDKNQTLVPPKDYTLRSVAADGAYLKVEYILFRSPFHHSIVVVYLTDTGREIGRSIAEYEDQPTVQPRTPVKGLTGFWHTLKALFQRS